MEAPESFVELLASSFRRRLRIRWSSERNEWHIEQFVRRGVFPGQRPPKGGTWDESSDAYIRNRDGVIHVLSVRTSDRMPCPRCGSTLKVPFGKTQVLNCAYCRLRGKPHAVPAMFVPLNDQLISYLKQIDPENPVSEALSEQLERDNQRVQQSYVDAAIEPTMAAFAERYNRIVGIPQWGLGGIKRFER